MMSTRESKPWNAVLAQHDNMAGSSMSNSMWLETHDRAMPEREDFARRIADLDPKVLIDIGCGNGLWWDRLHRHVSPECTFVGLDHDVVALGECSRRAEGWKRDVELIPFDVDTNLEDLPDGDVYTMFNVLPYFKRREALLHILCSRKGSRVAIRQWDTTTIRFGPLPASIEVLIEKAVTDYTQSTAMMDDRYLDAVFELLHQLPWASKSGIGFEDCVRTSPYSESFIQFFNECLDMYALCTSAPARSALDEWRESVGSRFDRKPNFYIRRQLTAVLLA